MLVRADCLGQASVFLQTELVDARYDLVLSKDRRAKGLANVNVNDELAECTVVCIPLNDRPRC